MKKVYLDKSFVSEGTFYYGVSVNSDKCPNEQTGNYGASITILFLKSFLTLRMCPCINSLTTKKHTEKFSSANLKKMLSPGYIILRTQRLKDKSVHESPHQDLCCFQIHLFSSLVLKELTMF